MARGHGAAARFYVDEFDASGVANAAGFKFKRQNAPATAFSDEAERKTFGKYGWTANLNTLFDTTLTTWDADLHNQLTTTEAHYLLELGTGLAVSSMAREYRGFIDGKEDPIDLGNSVLINLTYAGDDVVSRGVVLASQAFTGTASSTGINRGAVSAGTRSVWVVRVISVSGTGSITFRVDESQDDAAGDPYAQITGLTIEATGLATAGTDNATFTGAGVARFTKTAAVEAWRRLTVSAFSGFTSVTVIATDTLAP